MSAAARPGAARDRTPLVEIQAGDRGNALYCVHPLGGTVMCYAALARRLGTDRPVWALEAPGVDGERPPLDRVERLAERGVDAIRARQPRGPYVIAGWSFGGLVAFEIACRLHGDGTEALPILIDTRRSIVLEAAAIAENGRVNDHLPENRAAAEAALAVRLARGESIASVVRDARRGGWVPEGIDDAALTALAGVARAHLRARESYRPRPFAGRLVALVAEGAMAPGEIPAGEWSALALGGVEVHVLPGQHDSLLVEPGVEGVADRIRRCLEESFARPAGRKEA